MNKIMKYLQKIAYVTDHRLHMLTGQARRVPMPLVISLCMQVGPKMAVGHELGRVKAQRQYSHHWDFEPPHDDVVCIPKIESSQHTCPAII